MAKKTVFFLKQRYACRMVRIKKRIAVVRAKGKEEVVKGYTMGVLLR